MSAKRVAKAAPEKLKTQQLKGTLGNRCLKMLEANKDKVIFYLSEGEELVGRIKGVGQYTILINNEGGDVLLFKHAVKYLMLKSGEAKR